MQLSVSKVKKSRGLPQQEVLPQDIFDQAASNNCQDLQDGIKQLPLLIAAVVRSDYEDSPTWLSPRYSANDVTRQVSHCPSGKDSLKTILTQNAEGVWRA